MSASNSIDSLRDIAQELVGHGIKAGADEVEVTFQAGDEFSLDIRRGEIENLTESGSRAVSLKIILEQKI